jgi:DNA-binding CsgD family transcriptional regulator
MRDADAPVLSGLAGEFSALVDACGDCAYGIEHHDARPRIGFSYERGMTALIAAFRDYAPSHPGGWGTFRPDVIEQVHRNRVFSWAESTPGPGVSNASAPATRDLFPAFGVRSSMRVLVTEGAVLLAYVAVFRPDPTPFSPREARIFQQIVPAIAERLRIERLFADAPVHVAALAATLEAVPAAALVVSADCVVHHANAAGRRWLDDEPASYETLRSCVFGTNDAFSLTKVSAAGYPPYWLMVHRCPKVAATTRAYAAARHWALTPRQTEVLALLVGGAANKSIAVSLGCAENTVEVHVTAILRRAQVGSRAELIAKVFEIA